MSVSTTTRVIMPGGSLKGETRPPGDKSITHRAVILAALSKGTSRVVHPLEAADCERTAEAFRSLGIAVELDKRAEWIIVGHGLHGQDPALYVKTVLDWEKTLPTEAEVRTKGVFKS